MYFHLLNKMCSTEMLISNFVWKELCLCNQSMNHNKHHKRICYEWTFQFSSHAEAWSSFLAKCELHEKNRWGTWLKTPPKIQLNPLIFVATNKKIHLFFYTPPHQSTYAMKTQKIKDKNQLNYNTSRDMLESKEKTTMLKTCF